MRKTRKKTEQKRGSQKGAVIIEASIALPVFMFFMFTFYSVIQIANVQARMTVALDAAAKELAEYTHVFYATGMNKTFDGEGGKSSATANDVAEFLSGLAENLGSVNSELGQFVDDTGKALSNDSITDYLKDLAGKGMAKQIMKKNMVTGFDDTPEAFMKRNRIEHFNMDDSNYMQEGSNKIFLKASYDIRVIRLLNTDFSFHMSSCAYTEAWSGK